MSRPGSLKSFRKEKRDGDVTSGAACFKEATTEAKAAPRAPLSGVVGDHEKKKEARVGADTMGDSPQKASCRSNKTRSEPTKVKRKAPPPPPPPPPPLTSSDRPTVFHTSPSQSAPSRPIPVRPAPPPQRQPRPRKAAPPRPPPPTMKQPGKKSGIASDAAGKGPSIIKKKTNEICKYPKDLNPFANSSSAPIMTARRRTAIRPSELLTKCAEEEKVIPKGKNIQWIKIHLMILMTRGKRSPVLVAKGLEENGKNRKVMLKRCVTSPLTLVVEGVEENEKSLKVKNTQSNSIHGVIPTRERALRVRSRPKLLTVGDEHCHSRSGASKEQPARFDFQQ